jgi:hypothetical protein
MALAAGAALAALRGETLEAGTLWGAVESLSEREPKVTTGQALEEYRPYVERVEGPEFEQARARGRTLSLEDAVEYALERHP